jgi:hypothetical protein
MRKLLDREDDRDAVLSSFVSGLATEGERLLRALLAESEDEHGAGTGTAAEVTARGVAEGGPETGLGPVSG